MKLIILASMRVAALLLSSAALGQGGGGLVLLNTQDIDFGLVTAGTAGRSFTVDVNGIVSSSPNQDDAISGGQAGRIVITDINQPSVIQISAVAGADNGGLRIEAIHCRIGAVSSTNCSLGIVAITDGSDTLDVGLEILTLQSHQATTGALSLDINVDYQ